MVKFRLRRRNTAQGTIVYSWVLAKLAAVTLTGKHEVHRCRWFWFPPFPFAARSIV